MNLTKVQILGWGQRVYVRSYVSNFLRIFQVVRIAEVFHTFVPAIAVPEVYELPSYDLKVLSAYRGNAAVGHAAIGP